MNGHHNVSHNVTTSQPSVRRFNQASDATSDVRVICTIRHEQNILLLFTIRVLMDHRVRSEHQIADRVGKFVLSYLSRQSWNKIAQDLWRLVLAYWLEPQHYRMGWLSPAERGALLLKDDDGVIDSSNLNGDSSNLNGGDFSWFKRLCVARWKPLKLCPLYDSSSDCLRLFRTPCNRWSPPLSTTEIENIETRFGFHFPQTYRRFLCTCYRPEKAESRLLLTDWRSDTNLIVTESSPSVGCRHSLYSDDDDDDDDVDDDVVKDSGKENYDECEERLPDREHFNMDGELWSLKQRQDRATNEMLNKVKSFPDSTQLRYHLGLSLTNNNNTSTMYAPRLIPIANGLHHYFMFESCANCELVVEFSYVHGQLCLTIVAPNLATFLLQYYTEHAHSHRGWRGAFHTHFDFDQQWTPTTAEPKWTAIANFTTSSVPETVGLWKPFIQSPKL